MMRLGVMALLAFAVTAVASTPADAVACAAMDLRAVPPADRPYIKYHTLYAVPEKDRAEFLKPYSFHVNTLSRKAKLRPFSLSQARERLNPLDLSRVITNDLVRLDTRNFKWPLEVYERLAQVDPYFREARIEFEEKEVEVVKDWPGGVWPKEQGGDGNNWAAGKYKTKEKQRVPKAGKNLDGALWLPNDDLAYLIKETRSRTPVLRADWFFTQTAVSKDRVAGYYDFLEVKSRDDFHRLVGFDAGLARGREAEVASIFRRSGVSARNRQIYRFGAIDMGLYQTRDAFNRQTKDRNAVDALNGDFKHQAERLYGPLPNKLFAYHLNDDKGAQQKTAPPDVGPDKASTSNDGEIHAYVSCVRCHLEGLRPLNDYGRQLWQGGNVLVSYSKEKLDRLEQLYLIPLQQEVEDDNAKFARSLRQLNGPAWTPQRNAAAVKKLWEAWHDADVTPEVAARELGCTEAHLLKSLERYVTPPADGGLGQQVPNSLVAFLRRPALPMLREHFEEHYALLQRIIRGLIVADAVEKKPGH
jgi:hypothetical protein